RAGNRPAGSAGALAVAATERHGRAAGFGRGRRGVVVEARLLAAAQRACADRLQPGRHGSGLARARLPRLAAEDFAERAGEVRGLDVLDVVDVKPRSALAAAGVEPLDPLLRLRQVTGLRRDHDDRVDAFERDEAEHAGQRRPRTL